ncbi:MAG TPA: YeeE/YedE thiosulfate transporter family protein [Deferrisomatales bacterium]|nr:YeeE/YedE thiosulfate transporter family protein [Deferrisomatales bacterium]
MLQRGLIGAAMLLLGGGAGWVMHRSDYCLSAMFRDLFLFRSGFLLRTFALLVVATAVLFELARLSGALSRYPFPLLTPPILAGALGGTLFGVGMVLAGGCVVGTLYKMGSGNAVNATAFVGMLLGSAVYAELHPLWAGFASRTRLSATATTLPQFLGVSPGWFVVALTTVGSVAFWHWHRRGLWSRETTVAGYLQPWRAALLLSLISVAAYCVAGMPLGITTCYAKIAAAAEHLIAPEHAASVAFFNLVPLKLDLPWAGIRLSGGPGPGWDDIALIQGGTIVGLVLGGGASAAVLGEWRFRASAPPRQFLSALLGGVLLALGSRTAFGCNVWFLLGGVPIFAAQSGLFLAGLLPGTWLGTRLLTRVVLPAHPTGQGSTE